MKVVGITGGIGSGKSTVSKIFETLGIPVFIADDEAKKLYANSDVKQQVIALFGELAYTNQTPNFAYIANQIFNNESLRTRLNNIIHPAVKQRFIHWQTQFQQAPYVLREAAILIESGAYRDCFKIIVVSAPEAIRVSRVVSRDQTTQEAVIKRIQAQMSDADRLQYADFEIVNDGAQLLIPQVLHIHQSILNALHETV